MEVSPGPHPNPTPNPHHRKIELQSLQDLTYLQDNLTASARQKLDLHFPPSAYRAQPKAQPATIISLDGIRPATPDDANADKSETKQGDGESEEQDPLRARVKSLVDAFMFRMWTSASQNVTVNGLDAALPSLPIPTNNADGSTSNGHTVPQPEREGVDFTYEAYDSRLQSKLADLYGELEALTAQVSKLRRTAPAQGAEAYTAALMAEIEKEEAEHETRLAAIRAEHSAQENQNVLNLKPVRDGWQEDVQAMYTRGTAELARLAGATTTTATETAGNSTPSLTETVGKVQRARTVAMEFE